MISPVLRQTLSQSIVDSLQDSEIRRLCKDYVYKVRMQSVSRGNSPMVICLLNGPYNLIFSKFQILWKIRPNRQISRNPQLFTIGNSQNWPWGDD